MSRTYHHGDKKKEQKFKANWQWFSSAPKYFSKMTRHKPQRAKTTIALKQINGMDLDDMDSIDFPLDKKPIEYYW